MGEWAKETGERAWKRFTTGPIALTYAVKALLRPITTRASGFRNSKAFCGLGTQVLDDAAAGEGAACDGRDNNLAHISMCSLSLSFAIPTLPLGRCKVGMSYRNASSVILV
jgi:hypothetical protein